MSEDVRPEVIGRAAADVADVELRAMGEKDVILAELTDAEKRVLAKGSAIVAVNMLRDVGMLKDPPTVLDATNRQLKSIAAVWGVLARWDSSLDLDRRLSDQLKVLPAEDAADRRVPALGWAGVRRWLTSGRSAPTRAPCAAPRRSTTRHRSAGCR